MIFVTTGTQLPFDRLLGIVDNIHSDLNQKVIVQAGQSNLSPVNFEIQKTFSRDDFETVFKQADVIVSHAGMGTILTALKYNKKIIIFPRLCQYQEHRNDHQLATAEYMKQLPNVLVANNQQELMQCLLEIKDLNLSEKIETKNRDKFINNLSSYIQKVIK
jgi:UDP-N-acetylglucosamine transferase subunit ALG13